MSQFIRLQNEGDKAAALSMVCSRLRKGKGDERVFSLTPDAFEALPGKPFAYWVSDAVRETFRRLPAFESEMRAVKQGLATADDFRFVRGWWEVVDGEGMKKWFPIAKGGAYSPFYADVYLKVNWSMDGLELTSFLGSVIRNPDYYLQPGLTWPARPHRRGAFSHVSSGCIFSHTGTMLFLPSEQHWAYMALLNSDAYIGLLHLLMPRGDGDSGQTLKYEVGYVKSVSLPLASEVLKTGLSKIAQRAWSLKRTLDTVEETSHAFVLPNPLRYRLGDYDPLIIETELECIQAEINAIAFDLYGFNEADRITMQLSLGAKNERDFSTSSDDDGSDGECTLPIDQTSGMLSWAVGVAFNRFDSRLATGERAAPTEPDPFDPLPEKSPGMLPDGAAPFHTHSGVLVEDQGHPHDLARLVEEVLARVEAPVPENVRRWLQRDFFPFHLQRYSKSRRKAPIYWPLSTTSGSYTLWIYYPSLTSQTLYTAINDFVEPKLKQVGADVTALRNKAAARTRDDEKQFEALQAFELELIELRDTLLKLAPTYKPNLDDGVQISAAPLWPLFRHKPWQKVLKDTWAKLEKGNYDWAHLAMNYWPERVREKCKTDKSLAIAHGLEDLYVEPEAAPKKARGIKKTGSDE